MKCHCGAEEGKLHELGCDMKRCRACGGQLISCYCTDEVIEAKKYSTPWINIPNLRGLCGWLWPDLFCVPDKEWKYYVPPNLQEEELCPECYNKLKQLFPEGWKNAI